MNTPALWQFLNACKQQNILLDVSVIGLAAVGILEGVFMLIDLVQIANKLLDPVSLNVDVPAFPVVASARVYLIQGDRLSVSDLKQLSVNYH